MSDKSKTLKEKMAQLDEYVGWFESEDFEIEEALTKFAEAQKLAQEIEGDLSSLKNEVVVLKEKFDKS